ncbi:MAG TPA: hypothetical protein VFT78_09110, partial [Hanamia sp.]|nr:hypothetical protein [Hanamia sp.]
LNFTIPVFKWPLPSNHIEIQFFEPQRRKGRKKHEGIFVLIRILLSRRRFGFTWSINQARRNDGK